MFSNFNENLLGFKRKKYFRFIIFGIISVVIIIIIIVLAVCLSGGSDDKKDKRNEGEQEEQEEISGSCPEIKYVSGGRSGSGFASRYWDCCKLSCSWTENAGSGNEAKQCDASATKIITDYSAKSICDGGYASACLSQIPFTINGCDNIGFAFAASPGEKSKDCGKCFLLEFTGAGKYETVKNHRELSNKKLIVMSSNIGYDVSSTQFDVMIPGGGVGILMGVQIYWEQI